MANPQQSLVDGLTFDTEPGGPAASTNFPNLGIDKWRTFGIGAPGADPQDGFTRFMQFKVRDSGVVTVSTAGTTTTIATATDGQPFLPVGALFLALGYITPVAVTVATSVTFGDGTGAARFGTGSNLAAGARVLPNQSSGVWNPANGGTLGPWLNANGSLVLTFNGTPGAGTIHVVALVLAFSAPGL